MSRTGIRIWYVRSMIVAAAAACAGGGKPIRADPQPPSGSSGDDKRTIRYEPGELGFEQSLEVRRSKTAVPHELRDGDSVTNGDRIRASVTTSEDAHVYLAFCAGRELAIFPSQRGFRTTAGVNTQLPGGNGALVIAGDPGPEVLYVILSRDELSLTDPRLAQHMAVQRGSKGVDCAALDATVAMPKADGSAKPPGPARPANPPRGKVFPKKPRPTSTTGGDRDASPSRTRPAGDARWPEGDPQPGSKHAHPAIDPGPTRLPDGTLAWYGDSGINTPAEVIAADATGIAVVRYKFTHEASPVPP